MTDKLCHYTIIIDAWPIELRQTGPENFTVVYGKSVKRGLNYATAAFEYGAAIMHALACEGKLDNSEVEDASN